jgi:amidase
VRVAADALARAGYDVVLATPPLDGVVETWAGWLVNELRPSLPLFAQLMGPGARAFLQYATEAVPARDVGGMIEVMVARHRLARAWAEFQEQQPLLLSPVWTEPAFPHGRDVASLADAEATLRLIRCVLPANLLGLPAAVVPAAVADGLPIGVQITGQRFREDLCLDAAAAIEAALGTLTPL